MLNADGHTMEHSIKDTRRTERLIALIRNWTEEISRKLLLSIHLNKVEEFQPPNNLNYF